MKVVLCFLLLLSLHLKSQDSLGTEENYSLPFDNPRPFEFGYTFLTVNSNLNLLYTQPGEPIFEFLNGVLARYKYQNLSLRFHASYLYKKTKQDFMMYSTQDFGEATLKDYKIGTGLQYSFVKKRDYFYAFLDVNYHKRVTTASINNILLPYQTNLVSKLNGFDLIPGIGSKIKLVKIYMLPWKQVIIMHT
ncbi:MAG: hypothetical protein V4580_11825 [Bacteroidota bacterium]